MRSKGLCLLRIRAEPSFLLGICAECIRAVRSARAGSCSPTRASSRFASQKKSTNTLANSAIHAMSTAPNIEMIANSLRNCSLNYQNTPSSPSSSSSSTSSSSYHPNYAAAQPPPAQSIAGDLTVELNSDVALPFHWEQCLDIRSGQVYFINWEDGTRTTVDPRSRNRSIYYYESSSNDESPDTYLEEGAESEAPLEAQQSYYYYSSDTDSCSGINTESSYTSNISSTPSSFSPTESSSSGGFDAFSGASNGGATNSGEVLVAAGCKACFMYFMVPKHVDLCPKCGGAGLLHLGRA